MSTVQTWRFSVFEVDTRRVELRRDGTPVKMREQSFLILVYLLEHAGEIVTREELSRVLWPSDTFVDFYHGLNMAVMTLRDALGDSSETPLYIETVPKHGYRFIAPVSAVGYRVVLLEEDSNRIADNRSFLDSPSIRSADATMSTLEAGMHSHLDVADDSAPAGRRMGAGTPNRRLGSFRLILLAASILAAGFATAVWYLLLPLPPPRISNYFQITHDGYDKMPVGTDGSRVYYNQVSPQSILQVAASGGMIATTQVSVPGGGRLNLLDVSPDGANLLIGQQVPGDEIGALWNVRVLGGSARRLGAAIFAVFSPDGNSIAYVPKRGEIWLVRSDGSGAHRLVSMSGNSNSLSIAYSLSWSPDGATIRFFCNNAIWEVLPDGSNLHQLFPGWHPSSYECCGHWTADGRFFFFLLGESSYLNAQIWAHDERRGLFRKPRAEPYQLTSGPMVWDVPIPSRDGRRIFAEGRTIRGELYRLDPGTNQFQPYLGGISAEFLDFSRDGKSVAWTSYPEGVLWRASRDGSDRVQVTEPNLYPLLPRWSPDGTRFVFSAWTAQQTLRMYTVSSQGGSPQQLLPEDPGQQSDPNWSPDGSKIVFGAGIYHPWSKGQLRILDVVTRQVTSVPDSEGKLSPRWSPDGRYLAALTLEGPALRVFDFRLQRWSTMALKGDVKSPVWSADSKFIYSLVFEGTNPAVFRVRVTGGDVERIADLKDWHLTGFFNFSLTLDPTDAPLVLREMGSNDIYALTLEEK